MPLPSNAGPGSRGRVSVFKELGLAIDEADVRSVTGTAVSSLPHSPTGSSTKASDQSRETLLSTDCAKGYQNNKDKPWYRRAISRLTFIRPRPRRRAGSSVAVAAFPSVTHVAMLILLFIIVLPGLRLSVPIGRARYTPSAAYGGPVSSRSSDWLRDESSTRLEARADSPTDTCLRWSHQSAVVNGTLYIYGGQSKTSSDQNSDTWNNNFLALPLTSSFQTGSPALKGLPQPPGPPPVANGYLWNSMTSLYLYGGLFSDKPPTSPTPFSLWEYDLTKSAWKEHKNPRTSAGNDSEPAGIPVERAAEGAGLSVPELGRGWYFGGHLDAFTTQGWSVSTPRVYLRSFIEYTFPGAKNSGVRGLEDKPAGPEGAWRNITQGGIQDLAGFTNRADGVILYVPGFGPEGIIIGLAGGTNATFTQMDVVDVYDIASSSWYKQSTSGETPQIRVNPCAVVAAAPDGSSYNVHMYGGQNLIPYGEQIQYDDMWILTIPSFTWIKVNTTGQYNPKARAGHSCNIWDGQMIVVGGYVGKDLTCESPGVHVFDLSKLTWEKHFTALTGGNARGQQPSQQTQQKSVADLSHVGLSGSYGYAVPKAVQAVVGGNENGGATVTKPVQMPSKGPIATGKPALFTVTQSGATVTQTGQPGPGNAGSGGKGGPNIAAIVAGVVAGLLAIAAGYFAFCAWIYRKQLALFKNHLAMSQRASAGNFGGEKGDTPLGLIPRSSDGSTRHGETLAGSSNGVPTSSATRDAGTTSSAGSSVDDLLAGQEPTFLGVLLSPRRSLRVINRD